MLSPTQKLIPREARPETVHLRTILFDLNGLEHIYLFAHFTWLFANDSDFFSK